MFRYHFKYLSANYHKSFSMGVPWNNKHLDGRISNSDWFVNTCMMVVNENLFLVQSEFGVQRTTKIFSVRIGYSGWTKVCSCLWIFSCDPLLKTYCLRGSRFLNDISRKVQCPLWFWWFLNSCEFLFSSTLENISSFCETITTHVLNFQWSLPQVISKTERIPLFCFIWKSHVGRIFCHLWFQRN